MGLVSQSQDVYSKGNTVKTEPTSRSCPQLHRFRLKEEARQNMVLMLASRESTSHSEISLFKDEAPKNMLAMFSTLETS